jgi:hypothetical protein
MMPAGRFRRSRPGAEVTSLRPREPHSLRQTEWPAGVLHESEIHGLFGSSERDKCQDGRCGQRDDFCRGQKSLTMGSGDVVG